MPLFSTRKLIKNKRILISSSFLKRSLEKKEKCHPVASKMPQIKVELKYSLANTDRVGK